MIQMPVKERMPLLIEPPAESLKGVFSAYHISETAHCRPFCRKNNLFYIVEDPRSDTRVMLRVSGLRRSEQELAAEALWMCEIRRDSNLLVPQPLQSGTGSFCTEISHPLLPQNYYCMMFSYLRGMSPEADTCSFAALLRQLGGLAAQLHQNAILWNCAGRLPRPTLDGEAVSESRLEKLADAGELIGALSVVRERLAGFGRTPDRFGLIHADLRPANLLLDRDSVAVLDFDDCGYGWFLYDFAASVSGMELHPLLPKLTRAWLEGYRTYRKISREEANELPTFLMLHRLLRLDRQLREGDVPGAFAHDTAVLAGQYLHAHR